MATRASFVAALGGPGSGPHPGGDRATHASAAAGHLAAATAHDHAATDPSVATATAAGHASAEAMHGTSQTSGFGTQHDQMSKAAAYQASTAKAASLSHTTARGPRAERLAKQQTIAHQRAAEYHRSAAAAHAASAKGTSMKSAYDDDQDGNRGDVAVPAGKMPRADSPESQMPGSIDPGIQDGATGEMEMGSRCMACGCDLSVRDAKGGGKCRVCASKKLADEPVVESKDHPINPNKIKPPKGQAQAPGKTIGAIQGPPGAAAPVAMRALSTRPAGVAMKRRR